METSIVYVSPDLLPPRCRCETTAGPALLHILSFATDEVHEMVVTDVCSRIARFFCGVHNPRLPVHLPALLFCFALVALLCKY
jgi:hypothetical protein